MCYLISLPQVILCAVMIRAYGLEFMVVWFYGFRVRVRVRAPLYVMILYVGFVEKPLKGRYEARCYNQLPRVREPIKP